MNIPEVTIGQLHTAIECEEFKVVYQPIVSVQTNCIVQAEALLRWKHPYFGMLTPEVFLPLCESTGLINSIGQWVLETAGQQIKYWHALGHTRLAVSVNLSASQLNDPEFFSFIKNMLMTHNIPAKSLKLELTESLPIQNIKDKKPLFNALQNLGIQLSLDDFGMGYASLNYLRHLAFNMIKIDKSFIADIAINPVNQIIVEAVIGLGKKLGLTLIAEGVENAEQLAILKNLQCDMVQGYFYSMPVTQEKFTELLACNTVDN